MWNLLVLVGTVARLLYRRRRSTYILGTMLPMGRCNYVAQLSPYRPSLRESMTGG